MEDEDGKAFTTDTIIIATGATETEFALGKTNIILIAVAFVVIVVGFLLMLGPGTTPEAYNPDIFSFRRIVLAPGIAFAGFVFMVYAIMRNSK